MLRPDGCMELGTMDGRTAAVDTVQCGHCSKHQRIKPGQSADQIGNFCRSCMRHMCPHCVGLDAKRTTRGCVTIERQIEEAARRNSLSRAMGL